MEILLCLYAFARFAGKGIKCFFVQCRPSLAIAGLMMGSYTDLTTVSIVE